MGKSIGSRGNSSASAASPPGPRGSPPSQPDVVAHRGLTVAAPENTLRSIQEAAAARIQFVEVDVRASRDGDLFLLHDASLDRVALNPVRLAGLSSAEASAIRHADGSPLARLEDALDLASPDVTLCLDVKEAQGADRLLAAIVGKRDVVRVWSQHARIVRAAAAARVGATLISAGVLPRGIGAFLWEARSLGASAVSFYPADLEAHIAAACRNAGMPFFCGTPNDVATWRVLVRRGVSAIITDRPLELRALLEREVASSS